MWKEAVVACFKPFEEFSWRDLSRIKTSVMISDSTPEECVDYPKPEARSQDSVPWHDPVPPRYEEAPMHKEMSVNVIGVTWMKQKRDKLPCCVSSPNITSTKQNTRRVRIISRTASRHFFVHTIFKLSYPSAYTLPISSTYTRDSPRKSPTI